MARTTRSTEEEEVIVKIGRSGGRVESYSIEGSDPTVADALEAAGISLTKGERIRLNGESADEDEEIQTDDIITIAGKVSGGGSI